jgi:DNA-binding LacI/PurR family transcriptional regulator
VIAKGLAQSKTFNICVVMPGNYELVDLPFFQEVLIGIQEEAEKREYDTLLCISREDDVSGLERILSNRKVDGVLLLRTFVKDLQIELLQNKNMPFVTVGSTEYRNVPQIDHDHENACRELTAILLAQGMKRIALLGGNDHFVVNKSRFHGFEKAYEECGKAFDPAIVYWNLDNKELIEHAVDRALESGADCLLCMDDAICGQALLKLRQDQKKVPEEVCVASFYNSLVLENNTPSVTALAFDARALGNAACTSLFAQIEHEDCRERTLLSYEVRLRESTRRV